MNNNTLKELVKVTESSLQREKKADIDDVCERIQQATDANIATVVNFGAAATDPADLLTAIDLYRLAEQNPRASRISISVAIKNASEMISEVIKSLFKEKLDKMADTLKASNPDFASGWDRAREVINLGSTTGKIRGTVLDEMDVPKSNVKLTIYKAGTTDAVSTVITDAKGKFNASDLLPGDYDLVWELDGY